MPPKKGKVSRTDKNTGPKISEQIGDGQQDAANKRRVSGTAQKENANGPKRPKKDATPQTPKILAELKGEALNLFLQPLSDIHEIFSHITNKALDKGPEGENATLDDVVTHLSKRPLRVATMCSGSESPILALKLVQQCLRQVGKAVFELSMCSLRKLNHSSKPISIGIFHHLCSFATLQNLLFQKMETA